MPMKKSLMEFHIHQNLPNGKLPFSKLPFSKLLLKAGSIAIHLIIPGNLMNF